MFSVCLVYNKLKTGQSFSARVSPSLCKCLSLGGGAGGHRWRRAGAGRSGGCGLLPVPSQESLRFGFNTCEPREVTGAEAGVWSLPREQCGSCGGRRTGCSSAHTGLGVAERGSASLTLPSQVSAPLLNPQRPLTQTLEPASFKHRKAGGI